MPLFEADEQTEAIVIYTEPGRPHGGPAGGMGGREQLAPADRGLHGRPLHGRRGDEGHVASATPARSSRARRTPPPRRSAASRPPESLSWSGSTPFRTPSARSSGRLPDGRVSSSTSRWTTSVRGDAELAKKLEEVCPVDIFKATAGRAWRSWSSSSTSACSASSASKAAPPGAVRVVKLYDGTALERLSPRGSKRASAGRPGMTVGDDRQRGNRGAGAPIPALSP